MKTNKHLQTLLFNWPAKVLSLVFALLIYAFIQYSTLETRVVTIPLSVQLPEHLVAESLIPQKVDVQIKGNESIIYLVDPASITASIDFSDVRATGIAARASCSSMMSASSTAPRYRSWQVQASIGFSLLRGRIYDAFRPRG